MTNEVIDVLKNRVGNKYKIIKRQYKRHKVDISPSIMPSRSEKESNEDDGEDNVHDDPRKTKKTKSQIGT